MIVTIYMAITADGFIAKANDDTSWVSPTDWDNFRRFIKEAGVIVMGRRTYEASGDDFPYENALNIVMTRKPNLVKNLENIIFTSKSPIEIVNMVRNKGYNKLLVIGGGVTNSAFLKEGLVDELVLSLHPLVLGTGIKLFEGSEFCVNLTPVSTKELKEGLVQIKYKVNK